MPISENTSKQIADSALSTALQLRERGIAAHWLRSQSKIPLAKGWSTVPPMTAEELTASYAPGYNLGIRLGYYSQPLPGYGLVVADIDIKDDDARFEPYEVLYRFFDLECMFEVQSGSGLGRHQWFLCPFDDLPPRANVLLAKSGQTVTYYGKHLPAWTIEILSTGKQLVVPPSIHPDTGQAYIWLSAIHAEIPPIPDSLLAAIKPEPVEAPQVKPPSISTVNPSNQFTKEHSIADAFRVVSWPGILEPHGWRIVREQGERQYWCRPGKRDEVSASTIGDVLYPFTTSTEFEPERGYTKFRAYAILEHGGDLSRAAKHLASLR